jgi:hypothetical protein
MRRFVGFGRALKTRGTVATAFVLCTAFVTASPADAHKKGGSHQSTPSASPTQTGCKPTPDQASIGIRALQTELMVAGLKCSAEQWNNFTAKFKATIKNDADRLQRLFSKSYGSGGASRMNSFVTQLANDASQRSNGFTEADYCKQEDVLFQKVLALTGAELERFSAMRSLAVPAPVALCEPEPVAAAPSPAMVVTTASPAGRGTN